MDENNGKIIRLGGTASCGRIYLKDLEFTMVNGTQVIVQKTHKEGVDMADMMARHKARYSLVGLFCRPGFRVLDFPCGSGYATRMLSGFGVIYEGRDFDLPTLEYARRIYGGETAKFSMGDLCKPKLGREKYDIVACIEGLEHIDHKFQSPLIGNLKRALKIDGTLIVSSPENPTGISGPSLKNKWHKWELTREDFLSLLRMHFGSQNVELITLKDTLHTGEQTTCFFGICHKNKENS